MHSCRRVASRRPDLHWYLDYSSEAGVDNAPKVRTVPSEARSAAVRQRISRTRYVSALFVGKISMNSRRLKLEAGKRLEKQLRVAVNEFNFEPVIK